MAVAASQFETYLDEFRRFTSETAHETPSWLRALREDAFARFCATGLPTMRDEDWRFTNIRALERTPFRLGPRAGHSPSVFDIAGRSLEGAAARLVFVNGHFSPELSALGSLPEGVTLSNIQAQITRRPEVVTGHVARFLDEERDPFCALNLAFLEDGAYVHVQRGTVLKQPIHLLFVSASDKDPIMTHPFNLIVVEQEGQASIVEDYVSAGAMLPTFSNVATQFVAGPNSIVEHTLIEREDFAAYNVSTLRLEQERNSNVTSHSFLLGGALVRNNVHPRLVGEGSECLINGLFVGSGRQHLDNYMLVEHLRPHCSSRQFYNGILDDWAHGVFHGRIVVHKDAQKTDAKQTNRNLLLKDDAQIDTKPQLEIYADDVKCTHGATIGQIEEDALFYLRSRGLSETESRQLLLHAFGAECLDRMMPGAARDHADAVVTQRLASLLDPAKSRDLKTNEDKNPTVGAMK
jgi:Fe-S cluster assembly protein SufD